MSPRHTGSRDARKKDARKKKGGRSKFLFRRRKFCKFCEDKADWIDYRDSRLLNNYIPERGKIQPRRTSGACSIHQRQLQEAIKRARNLALIPFSVE